jgi:putative two-component system response regulator
MQVAEQKNHIQDMQILLVDDHASALTLLTHYLHGNGFRNVSTLQHATEVRKFFRNHRPDLVLLDLYMPHLNGIQVLEQLQDFIGADSYFPVAIMSSSEDPRLKTEAFNKGAKDFILKPFHQEEVISRVKGLLHNRALYLDLEHRLDTMQSEVSVTSTRLEEAYLETIMRLSQVAEYSDDETKDHCWRVAQNAALIAYELGQADSWVKLLTRAVRLHDIGKVSIPRSILTKRGPLTPEEFEIVKRHTTIGADLLDGSSSEMLRLARSVAWSHHERWDGQGYPRKLKAEAIPLEGRIVAVADSFDVMTHKSFHQQGIAPNAALAELLLQKDKQFDPKVVSVFQDLLNAGVIAV